MLGSSRRMTQITRCWEEPSTRQRGVVMGTHVLEDGLCIFVYSVIQNLQSSLHVLRKC